MSYEIIENLVEKLSSEFILATPAEPESLSGLLPVLKQLHSKCVTLSLDDQAKAVLKARKLINALLHDSPGDPDNKMSDLEHVITGLSSSLSGISQREPATAEETVEETAQQKDHSPDAADQSASAAAIETAEAPVTDPGDVSAAETGEKTDAETDLERIETCLNRMTHLIGAFCPGEVTDLGSMLNTMDEVIGISKDNGYDIIHEIASACKGYVESMTLEDIDDTRPVEEGVVLLKSILSHLKREEVFAFDYSDVIELLQGRFTTEKEADTEGAQDQSEPPAAAEPAPISEDDMVILVDFVSEAEENLDTIEASLVDLEQDPANTDIINDIFRPFHTIKGVSGFLSLTKINTLSHATENLLDSARNGDFVINDTATDVILESVDTLKKLLEKVKTSTETGFTEPDDDIDVEMLREKLQQVQTALTNGEKMPLGEILTRSGNVNEESVAEALDIQREHPDRKVGEILVEEKKATPNQVASALMQQNQAKRQAASQVKVNTRKLDDLVDYAGELVIAHSMLKQKASKDVSLAQSLSQLGQIVNSMQNIAMSMRMIPIKSTFMKMTRLVRDLSRNAKKDVSLQMSGEDTEIDRNLVDAIYEPMVHMIRNSVDHGIEKKEERTQSGKPPQGRIVLRAYHKGGHIIIEIEDDGKGLDKEKILSKAMDSGVISGNEQLTDSQIYDLIMKPGFSTAAKITDVSGRGVGMDVVKDVIEKFRGELSIDSKKGRGTRFTISFPLTLAIIDGMLVKVEEERYVIPTAAIQKAFRPARDECFTVEGKGEMVKERGALIPVIRLNEIYHDKSGKKNIWEGLVVVVESKDEKRALLIDELLEKDEFVIKSLGSSLEDVDGLAGGAILADGRVGLILDIHGIFSIVSKDKT